VLVCKTMSTQASSYSLFSRVQPLYLNAFTRLVPSPLPACSYPPDHLPHFYSPNLTMTIPCSGHTRHSKNVLPYTRIYNLCSTTQYIGCSQGRKRVKDSCFHPNELMGLHRQHSRGTQSTGSGPKTALEYQSRPRRYADI